MSNKVSISEFINLCEKEYPEKKEFTRKELVSVGKKYDCCIPSTIWNNKCSYEVRPMKFFLCEKNTIDNSVSTSYQQYIPKKNNYFVSYGTNYKLIDTIIKTNEFFPLYIYGVSGLGKTFQIEQSCASNKRPYFRCQITKDTTNDDLIGSYSLLNGNTVWKDGPVLMAYRSGGILLLDEIDLNSSLMILQVVLENKPIYVTQTGELVYPSKGFNVFATGNSKGDGSDSKFVGTTVLNDAFLERFVSIIEQKIPTITVEEKIIKRFMELENIVLDEKMYSDFLKWINYVRDSYKSESTEIYISTRRVQYILKVYKLTNNFTKSMEVALSRYSNEDKDSLMMMWKACHEE